MRRRSRTGAPLYTRKVFAYFGGSVKVEDTWLQHPHSLVIKLDSAERYALLRADGRAFVPAYLGPSGWVGVDLDEDTNWAEVSELLDASYRITAPKRNVDELDAED